MPMTHGDGTKTCSSCRSRLTVDRFHKDGSRSDGLAKNCKPCETLRHRKYYNKIPNLQRRKYVLRYEFNLELEDYLLLLQTQEWRCAVCRERFEAEFSSSGSRGGPFVDHDHACCPGSKSCGNCVRGLLCMRCNTAAGLLRDDPIIIARLGRYLREAASV